jgi:predicted Zn-dependent peptidase
VLGGQFTSRLNEELRERKGLTYGIRSHVEARAGAGPFWIGASLQADRLGEAISEMRAELLALLGERPPTESELADARRSLIEGQARHFESPSALVARFGSLFLYGLPPDEHRRLPDRLEALTRPEILAAAARQFIPDSLVYVVVADAAQVGPQLERLEWAELEHIREETGSPLSG